MKHFTKQLMTGCLAVSLVFGCMPAHAEKTGGNEVAGLIKGLELGKPFTYKNLTIVPIYSKKVAYRENYLTLDEAVKNGSVLITELEGGRVPQVKVINKSGSYVFMMAGEILTGARQNRLVGKDVLLPPYSKEVVVPVYCVERGRWHGKSYEFSSTGIAAAPMFRKNAAEKASQGAIWDNVANYSMALGVSSETGDLSAAYSDTTVEERAKCYIGAMEQAIPRLEKDAIGVAVAIGGKIVTIDVFENPRLFGKLWPKLLRSYAMGAIAECYGEEDIQIAQDEVKNILNQLYGGRYERKPGIAAGEDLSLATDTLTSSALAYKSGVVHLSAFPDGGGTGRRPVIDDNERIPVLY
ncbi:MAG: DUF6569 family protein [Candidatus Omnitrophota bacterium]